jgi:hypothetical protein
VGDDSDVEPARFPRLDPVAQAAVDEKKRLASEKKKLSAAEKKAAKIGAGGAAAAAAAKKKKGKPVAGTAVAAAASKKRSKPAAASKKRSKPVAAAPLPVKTHSRPCGRSAVTITPHVNNVGSSEEEDPPLKRKCNKRLTYVDSDEDESEYSSGDDDDLNVAYRESLVSSRRDQFRRGVKERVTTRCNYFDGSDSDSDAEGIDGVSGSGPSTGVSGGGVSGSGPSTGVSGGGVSGSGPSTEVSDMVRLDDSSGSEDDTDDDVKGDDSDVADGEEGDDSDAADDDEAMPPGGDIDDVFDDDVFITPDEYGFVAIKPGGALTKTESGRDVMRDRTYIPRYGCASYYLGCQIRHCRTYAVHKVMHVVCNINVENDSGELYYKCVRMLDSSDSSEMVGSTTLPTELIDSTTLTSELVGSNILLASLASRKLRGSSTLPTIYVKCKELISTARRNRTYNWLTRPRSSGSLKRSRNGSSRLKQDCPGWVELAENEHRPRALYDNNK